MIARVHVITNRTSQHHFDEIRCLIVKPVAKVVSRLGHLVHLLGKCAISQAMGIHSLCL